MSVECQEGVYLTDVSWQLIPGSYAGPAGHSVLLLSFRSFFVFFSPPNLRSHWFNRHQTLPQLCSMVTQIDKFRSKMWGPCLTNLAAQSIDISKRFQQPRERLDREYLQSATRHHEMENGVVYK